MKKKLVRGLLGAAALFAVAVCPADKAYADEIIAINKNITIGGTFSDSLPVATENARYNFSVGRSGTVTIQIGFHEGSSSWFGSHGSITLYDYNGNKIKNTNVDNDTKGTDSSLFTADILAGNYYLIVDSQGKSASNYTVTTTYEDSGETVVDTLDNPHSTQANPIQLPLATTYTGHLADNGANDIYQLTLNADKVVTVSVTNRTSGINLSLVNTTNTVNKSIRVTDPTGSIEVFCPKGTYYINVNTYKNPCVYTVSATAKDIPGTKLKKVKNKKYQNMAVKFKLQSPDIVKGYHIQYSKHKKFKKGRNNVYINNTTYLKSVNTFYVQKKGTYYVRIRTYAEDSRGNKYYTKWTPAKKVVIKK